MLCFYVLKNKAILYLVSLKYYNTNKLHPNIRCAPTLFGKGSQVETVRSWPVQPNLT